MERVGSAGVSQWLYDFTDTLPSAQVEELCAGLWGLVLTRRGPKRIFPTYNHGKMSRCKRCISLKHYNPWEMPFITARIESVWSNNIKKILVSNTIKLFYPSSDNTKTWFSLVSDSCKLKFIKRVEPISSDCKKLPFWGSLTHISRMNFLFSGLASLFSSSGCVRSNTWG